jgi:hypothetical protein
MDDGASPTLEVGFAINAGDSFGELAQLERVMGSAEAKIVADAASIERATGGMINVGGATASIRAFGNAATREFQNVNREKARTEKAGEALIRQLEREAAALGRTKEQLRDAKVETIALAAAQQGNTDLADRLLAASRQRQFAAEAAAEAEVQAASRAAAAMQAQAGAAERLSREHAQLAAVVRGSAAAQDADAAAAERLRMSTDPLYAATSRLNAEIAESTRLYHAGATAPAEYARQQDVLTGRLRTVVEQHGAFNRATTGTVGPTKLAGHHMQNLAFQFQDLGIQMAAAVGSKDPVRMMLMAVAQQGSQIYGIMGQAGIGIRGVGAAFVEMSKKIMLATARNPYLLATAAAITAVAGAIKLLQGSANSSSDMEAYAKSLGLTAKEIRNLDNVTVTFGDTSKAVFQVAGRAIWGEIGPAITSVWEYMKGWFEWIGSGAKMIVNFTIGAFVAGYNIITKTWSMLPAAFGEAFYAAVNAGIGAINALIQKSVGGLNSFITTANSVLGRFGLELPTLTAPQIAQITGQAKGVGAKVGAVIRDETRAAIGRDYLGDFADSVGGSIRKQAEKNARDRLREQAEGKGYLDDEKDKTPKGDKHAERLARENEAIEAQIRNLYALADAYGVSGAAALIAEARVKAESDAIKKRGDIEMFVDRQIRLAIAQRVSDAAKATAGVRDQAAAQEAVNAMVAAGTVSAERAEELVKDQIADLPLLAALQAAQQRGLTDEATRATAALADQQRARERLRQEEEEALLQRDMASGAMRLAEMREELRLVGATDAARNRALATLRATQEAETKFTDPARRAAYVSQQVQIADETERLAAAQRSLNDALSFTADRWDLIASNISAAAAGLGEAFGSAGRAIGDIASIYASYEAERKRAALDHRQRLKEVRGDEAATARENAKYALETATAQVGAFGDAAAAAKGFFREGTDGYKALATAEKVFRAVEFAMSVRAIAQDAIETGSKLASSAARTAANAVEAVTKAIASLPFPANLAAGAATVAALAAIGVSIAGSFGGGGRKLDAANEGKGTVLGDVSAKSDSIKNAINALKEVDTLTNTYARQMASSLRSIESQIGGIATLVVRAGDINASAGVTEGFKTNIIGSVLSKIPLIGGILGGLFGSTTTVLGSGLYAGSQSLGSILNGGFDASYYSDIQKKKKLFGITTSNKTSTQYSAADGALETQFALLLRQFNDAIVAAAGPLGAATADIQNRLNSFVVSLGKIDLKGLTGAEIEEKLAAVFGAAADSMANAAFPGLAQFQKVGEGAFETLVRVASTIEAVSGTLDLLGQSALGMSIAAKIGLADQFESISALTDAADAYFQAFYTKEERAAAKAAQLAGVFTSLGLSMPSSLATFRQLVEAQDLNTAAGQATYATLLKLAPAFADLQSSMEGAKSAADVLSERHDLERRMLEMLGDTAALRALDLAKLDPSNRALQQRLWALQDAQDAAKAADELRKAWASVGDSIMDEVKRIRGLSDPSGNGSFATLMGQFNVATAAARGGDMDAAKALPGLSQALLSAAALVATSRQELDRVQAQTAASLEATNAALSGRVGLAAASSTSSILDAASLSQAASAPAAAANDDLVDEVRALREEVTKLRSENNAGHAATAANTGKAARTLESVTSASGGDAVSVAAAA